MGLLLSCCWFYKPRDTEEENISNCPYFRSRLDTLLIRNSVIDVKGYIPADSSGFAINLCTNRDGGEDIALHINPRLAQSYIVRNSRFNGSWGDEETSSPLPFTLWRNCKFQIIIFVSNNEFLIQVNGSHFCGFAFRAPLKRCKSIEVSGDVTDVVVEQRFSDYYPEPVRDNIIPKIPDLEYDEFKENNVYGIQVPYMGKFPYGLSNGKQIHIKGRVKILPHSFFVNIQCTPYIFPPTDILLHINPRFAEVGGKHIIVRNAYFNGIWSAEQRSVGYHFIPGSEFDLLIKCEDNQFSIWVNDQMIAVYPYRAKVTAGKYVYVQGDVELYEIQVEKLILAGAKKKTAPL